MRINLQFESQIRLLSQHRLTYLKREPKVGLICMHLLEGLSEMVVRFRIRLPKNGCTQKMVTPKTSGFFEVTEGAVLLFGQHGSGSIFAGRQTQLVFVELRFPRKKKKP